MRTFVRYLVAAAFIAANAVPARAEATPTVRVEVAPGNVVGDRVPKLFGYGGNIWWIPEVLGAGLAQQILDSKNLGLTRISLGDQILTECTSMEDLQHRLDNYPLNEFLRRYTKAGGRVLFILDAMPRWLAADKSARIFPSPGPSLKTYRMSPPADFEAWGRLVETIVRHFNGKLGLDAYYESWNEPNWQYMGTTEQYHRQYYYTVLGARRADARAAVGGPAISEVLAFGTRGDPAKTDDDKRALARRVLDRQFAFRRFLDYASTTPVPELGLKRLPVDFFSWHAYYIDPTNYYRLVVPLFRSALTATGYPANTPLITTEWNIAAEPPYPEGKLNATEVGASFVATTLLAMHENRIAGQIFQAYVDPGEPGVYLGGMFTQTGIARANFNAFQLFTRLRGREIRTRTTDPWVGSVAFEDDTSVYLLVASFMPTRKMTTDTLRLQATLANWQLIQGAVDARLSGQLKVPDEVAGKAREISENYRKITDDIDRKSALWKGGLTLEIDLSRVRGGSAAIQHFLVDSGHANIFRDMSRAERHVADRQKQIQERTRDRLVSRLEAAGIPRATAERLGAASERPGASRDIVASLSPDQRKAVSTTVAEVVEEARGLYREALREVASWPSAKLHEESVAWPSSGRLRMASEPYAVHLFVIPR